MEDIIDALGGPSSVARLLDCKPPSVSDWRKKGIPAKRCAEIEVETEGRFRCEGLNPAVPWQRVADAGWPWHPAGRPLIDITRRPAAQEVQRAA